MDGQQPPIEAVEAQQPLIDGTPEDQPVTPEYDKPDEAAEDLSAPTREDLLQKKRELRDKRAEHQRRLASMRLESELEEVNAQLEEDKEQLAAQRRCENLSDVLTATAVRAAGPALKGPKHGGDHVGGLPDKQGARDGGDRR